MGIDVVLWVASERTVADLNALHPKVHWRPADKYQRMAGATHVGHSGWRYFEKWYKRGPWNEIRKLITQLRAEGPVWYMTDTCQSPADLDESLPSDDEIAKGAPQWFPPLSDDKIAELDALWAEL